MIGVIGLPGVNSLLDCTQAGGFPQNRNLFQAEALTDSVQNHLTVLICTIPLSYVHWDLGPLLVEYHQAAQCPRLIVGANNWSVDE